MSNINRDYLIVLNPKTSKVTVPELNYYIYDKYTANLFVNLVTVENGKIVNMADADQYKLVLHVLKPTNEIQTVEDIQVFNKEKALFQIELDQELTKNIGRYKCELLTIDKTDHIVQSAKFSYRVKKSIYNDLDVVTETPQYPIIITLLDKLQDIDKYEEERRANEVARVAAEKARVKDYTDLRQTVTTDIDTMQEKIDSFDGKVQEVDSAVQQMRTNITNYQTEKNKELDSYKTQKDTQINTSIKNMENTIDTYKTEKDKQINDKITQQDTKIDKAIDLQNKNIQASTKALNDKLDAAVQDQNNTIAANNQAQNKVISDAVAAQNKTINTVVESDKVQNDRLDTLETNDTNNKAEIKKLQDTDVAQDERMTAIEAVNVEQNNRLDAIEIKNDQQDSRLNDVEAKNKKQDLDLKCLFAESHSERITLEDEVGNSVFLQNSKQGFATVDELKGNTLVNCNKDTDKELILNGNIDTSGYSTVTTTEGVDGGKVDVALEGNTMVNVCEQEDPIAITKNYEVTTGNHIALQGEYDGKCRPVLNGNTMVNLMTKYKDESLLEYFYPNENEDVANVSMLKPNTEYTFIYTAKYQKTGDTGCVIIHLTSSSNDGISTNQELTTSYSQYIYKFTTPSNVSNFVLRSNGSYFYVKECRLLEGDYTNKPIPDYFTGLQSSFEDNYVPENLYKFSSRDDFYLLDNNVILDGEYIKMTANGKYVAAMLNPLATIKPSTTYTIAVDVVENTLNSVLYVTNNSNNVQLPSVQSAIQINAGKTGIFTYTVTASNDSSGYTRCLVNYLDSSNTTGNIKYKIMVVEGDYTNYDFTNYDSTTGGKYKVDYKVTGKNKFDINAFTQDIKNNPYYEKISDSSFNIKALDSRSWNPHFFGYGIKVKKNTKYTISGNIELSNIRIIFPSISTNMTPSSGTFDTREDDIIYIKFIEIKSFPKLVSNIQIEEGTTATTYEPYKEYTKTFYLNSPLLEGDTIEQSGNNIVHMHRYNTITFDGSDDEKWVYWGNNTDNGELDSSLISFYLPFTNYKDFRTSTVFNNKFLMENTVWGAKTEIMALNADNIMSFQVALLRSKLATQNVAGFKTWLQANPITVAYELATPTREVISTNNNLLLDSYVNGHLDVDSIVPIEKVDFKQTIVEGLKYLYPNTEYIIQFEADNIGEFHYQLNGSYGDINVVKGINKFNLTTKDTINWLNLDLSGIGFNMSKVVVTPKVEQTFGYFKGMKSVGECEDLEVVSSNNDNTLSNKQTMTHEPLRGLPNGVKDKYVIIDGKWYIERNTALYSFNGVNDNWRIATNLQEQSTIRLQYLGKRYHKVLSIKNNILCDTFPTKNNDEWEKDTEGFEHGIYDLSVSISKSRLEEVSVEGFKKWLTKNPVKLLTTRATPTYEPIDYNPFEVYSNTTHISNNSNIPCNMVIRNSGFNCILKPNTTYTVSSNNGLSSVVTKASIGDSVLRFYDKDTTSVTKMNNVLVLEGDYITGNPPIPAFFKGMESTFEQELVTDEQDKNYGKYKVNVKATNPDNKQENNITFYIKEPLRGVGDVKDKVYVKEDKVVVERNCAGVTLDGSENKKISLNAIRGNLVEFIITDNLIPNRVGVKYVATTLPNIDGVVEKVVCGYRSIYIQLHKIKLQSIDVPGFRQWLQANPVTVVYELATPTYEEVEYFDLKLFVEIFKDTTIIYNSNIPVTSTINYTYSTPLTDAVNTVSDISDQQDSMIIDMATQVATMEMMLM